MHRMEILPPTSSCLPSLHQTSKRQLSQSCPRHRRYNFPVKEDYYCVQAISFKCADKLQDATVLYITDATCGEFEVEI